MSLRPRRQRGPMIRRRLQTRVLLAALRSSAVRLIDGSEVGRMRRTRRNTRILWPLGCFVRCSQTAQICLNFDRQNVRWDTDIGLLARHLTHFCRWSAGTLKYVFGFDMPIISDAQKANCHRWLLRLGRNVNVASEYRGLGVSSIEDPINSFYVVRDADAWWHELECEGRQRHHLRNPWFVGWLSLEMFALTPIERNDFYTWVRNRWDCRSNCVLGVSTPVILPY